MKCGAEGSAPRPAQRGEADGRRPAGEGNGAASRTSTRVRITIAALTLAVAGCVGALPGTTDDSGAGAAGGSAGTAASGSAASSGGGASGQAASTGTGAVGLTTGAGGSTGPGAGGQGGPIGPPSSAPRLIIFYTRWGTAYPDWWPTGSERNFSLGPVLAPLEPYKDKLIILSGLTNASVAPDLATVTPSFASDSGPNLAMMTLLTAEALASSDLPHGPSLDNAIGDCGGTGPPLR